MSEGNLDCFAGITLEFKGGVTAAFASKLAPTDGAVQYLWDPAVGDPSCWR